MPYLGGGFQGNDNFVGNTGTINTRNRDIEQKKTDQIGQVKEQRRLNDNISVGKDLYRKVKETKPAAKKPVTEKPAENFDFSHAQIGHGGIDKPGSQPKPRKGKTSILSRNARNTLELQQNVQIDMPQQTQQPAVIAPGQIRSNITNQGSGRIILQANAQAAAVAQPTPAPLPGGRVSLSVQFPTNGEPYRYKKLKDHANLEIIASKVIQAKTSLNWLWAIGAVALLLLGNLCFGKLRGRN